MNAPRLGRLLPTLCLHPASQLDRRNFAKDQLYFQHPSSVPTSPTRHTHVTSPTTGTLVSHLTGVDKSIHLRWTTSNKSISWAFSFSPKKKSLGGDSHRRAVRGELWLSIQPHCSPPTSRWSLQGWLAGSLPERRSAACTLARSRGAPSPLLPRAPPAPGVPASSTTRGLPYETSSREPRSAGLGMRSKRLSLGLSSPLWEGVCGLT